MNPKPDTVSEYESVQTVLEKIKRHEPKLQAFAELL